MINSKKECKFYIMADHMMNRGSFKRTLKRRIFEMFFPDYEMSYLRAMRKCSYYNNKHKFTPPHVYYRYKYKKLGLKLGFSIGKNVFGYGLVIPHYGTIVVGSSNKIGNYCVLHTSTCITDNGKIIGNALYLSTGAKITSKIRLGNNISIGANSVVNKSYEDNNALIAGSPAKYIKDSEPWYIRDGISYQQRVESIEKLIKTLKIRL